MKYIGLILIPPIAVISLLLLMAVDLVRMVQGKPTVDEEWHDVYVNGNLNHGQGRKDDEEK